MVSNGIASSTLALLHRIKHPTNDIQNSRYIENKAVARSCTFSVYLHTFIWVMFRFGLFSFAVVIFNVIYDNCNRTKDVRRARALSLCF